MQPPNDPVKKQREKQLIDDFIRICPDFAGWQFNTFAENPDAIYKKGDDIIGFDSIIISDDQASVQCVYNPQLCQLSLPVNLPRNERITEIETFFSNKLFSHLRRYSVPTVLVFTLVDTQSTSFEDIVSIAQRFKLPRLDSFNILAYYICDNKNYVRIASSTS